ncbi:restriction endonuclease subunit S [Photobacterium angustum]|uniref:restriction endonuclease subunit S n=1 Tax=Photobacterium angustum TaxID=661 RepID=UPI0005E09DF9|nr:restriction endonuclease subunit S [Photobacterium angustum]KJG17324.1 S-CspCI protein [Photobacterium angustum]KJG23707.1 S-CspCI protein [Photobacterium angustum]KJG30828.1 S-CspCI protein [Photobacterium angustum]PSW94197.1 S-CspCI protein [Photobacterium angustum]PSX02783.1 S-CspCI protein [Photobacterium angustum]
MTVRLDEIFNVSYGTKCDMNKMNISGNSSIAFVSRSSKNNGIVDYVDIIEGLEPIIPGAITVTLGGTYVLSAFLQEAPFYTGQNVAVLTPKFELTRTQKLYYCMCITKNRFRYSAFGREANRTLKSLRVPHFNAFPSWVNTVDLSKFDNADAPYTEKKNQNFFNVNSWCFFTLNEIFELKKGKRLTKTNMTSGSTPFIGSTDSNNGMTNSVGQDAIHDGNVITVNYNGSVGEAFYQPDDFWASDDVNVLYPRNSHFTRFNQYIAMFMIPVIKANKFKFSYGRKWHLDRMKETKIALPVKDGKIDLDFMEAYIKTLPYSSTI